MARSTGSRLTVVYDVLFSEYGPRDWWPAETPFEVAVGAILTQNTAWGNVEKAIVNLKSRGFLEPDAMRNASERVIAGLIRPSGYFNLKSKKLKSFMDFLYDEFGGSMESMKRERTGKLRQRLLSVWGLGPETVDSILLYALEKPSFVVDAYTRRMFQRIGFLEGSEGYGEIKSLFEEKLPKDVQLFNEYHALIVEHCKRMCLKNKPKCNECCLKMRCAHAKSSV
ncbi:MAG: endonuclease III domain-containing protein [Candidatus Altiarchaeota archaeon]|nr:endonuclease III domain-containing protein [Candidatus Altiarchaeota archaeon]